jgi:hypothetical protein
MSSRMEILKDHTIINENYKPSLDLDCQEYFNRAMVFAQTNYQEQLTKLSNIHFRKIAPTAFFEEYSWCVCAVGLNTKSVSEYFPQLLKEINSLYYQSFRNSWDRDFPSQKEMMDKSISIINNEKKSGALWQGARIINQGLKLYGWDRYRDNFLSSPTKLQVLPLIGSSNSGQLARDIGLTKDIYTSDTYLLHMIDRWGFASVNEMCLDISKRVVLQPRIIGQILWYAASHFGINI